MISTNLDERTKVAGTSSGIGVDFAHLLAENGCHLIRATRKLNRLRKLERTLQEKFWIKAKENNVQAVGMHLYHLSLV